MDVRARRRCCIVALAVGIVLAITGGQLGSSNVAGSSGPVAPQRRSTRASRRSRSITRRRRVQAIVQFNAPVSEAKAQADAKAHGRIIGKLPIIHGLAVRPTAGQARALATNPDVHAVSLNGTVTPQSLPVGVPHPRDARAARVSRAISCRPPTTRRSGVTPLWKFGVTGTGVGVAVIDTGIDGALPDFASADGSTRA